MQEQTFVLSIDRYMYKVFYISVPTEILIRYNLLCTTSSNTDFNVFGEVFETKTSQCKKQCVNMIFGVTHPLIDGQPFVQIPSQKSNDIWDFSKYAVIQLNISIVLYVLNAPAAKKLIYYFIFINEPNEC